MEPVRTPSVDLYMTGVRGLLVAATILVLAECAASGPSHGEVRAGAATTVPGSTPSTGAPPGSGSATVGSVVTVSVPPTTTISLTPTNEQTTVEPSTTPVPPPTTAAPVPPSGSWVYGLVGAGPTCPVERPGQPCPPQPVYATVTALGSSGATAGTTHSDHEGKYTLGLALGSYTLTATTGSALPRCSPTRAAVTAGSATRADISCDTGIR
jgi:hypothetical protein